MAQEGEFMQGRNATVLYLDFDGVLHHAGVHWSPLAGFHLRAPERYRMFQHVALLETLLRPYPDIKIVLSTSWVQAPHGNFEGAVSMLSPELRLRVIGQTLYPETTTSKPLSRGQQVLADVQHRLPKDWLAVDDVDEGFDRNLDHLVHSHQYEGLAGLGVAEDFSEKLKKLCSRVRRN
jgi:hypothetical protein